MEQITMGALIARINRRLRPDGEVLRIARDPEELARDLGVIRECETVRAMA
jgi:hypothetical protein